MSNPEGNEVKVENNEEKASLVAEPEPTPTAPPASAPVLEQPVTEAVPTAPIPKVEKSEEPITATAVVVTEQPTAPIDEVPLSPTKPAVEDEKVELKDIQKYADGCCIIGFSEAGTDASTGCQWITNFMCMQGTLACCKTKNEKFHVVFGDSNIVAFKDVVCNCYAQCFPGHLFCCHKEDITENVPIVQSPFSTTDISAYNETSVPCGGNCCTLQSCFLKFPECLGGYSKYNLLCLSAEYVHCQPQCFKAGGEVGLPEGSDKLCVMYRGNCLLEPNDLVAKHPGRKM
eukprot:gene26600-33203_t